MTDRQNISLKSGSLAVYFRTLVDPHIVLDNQISDNNETFMAIHRAFARNVSNTSAMEWLRFNVQNLDIRDAQGKTIIMEALMSGNCGLDTLKWLSENGVPLGVTTVNTMTELMYACWENCDDNILSYLIKEVKNEDYVNQTDADGWTALMIAVLNGATHVVRWFVVMPRKIIGK